MIASTNKLFGLLVAIVVLAVIAMPSYAALINMDYGKGDNGYGAGDSALYVGAGAIGSAGDFWNSTDTEANDFTETADLKDVTGALTGVTLTWSDEAQSSVNSGAIEFGSTGHNALMEDYAFTHGGTTATYTLSNLSPGNTYTLYLYGVPDGEFQDTLFTVTGANEGPQHVDMGQVADDNGLATPEDYVVFTGTVGAGGTIVYTQTTFSGQQGGFSGTNGFQLDMVPEPATMTLLALGGLAALRRRK